MVQRCITGEVIAHSVFCLSIWFVSENNSISISSVYVDSYLKKKLFTFDLILKLIWHYTYGKSEKKLHEIDFTVKHYD